MFKARERPRGNQPPKGKKRAKEEEEEQEEEEEEDNDEERFENIANVINPFLLEGEERTAVARTAVTFRALDEALLDWYLATGEWRGRAGAYAIQGAGAALVRAVQGDYENVVGLPLATLVDIYPELLR